MAFSKFSCWAIIFIPKPWETFENIFVGISDIFPMFKLEKRIYYKYTIKMAAKNYNVLELLHIL